MPQPDRFFRSLLRGGGPLMLWALHFFAAYVLVAAACCTAFGELQWLGTTALRLALWLWSALVLLAIAVLGLRSLRLPPGLLRRAALGSAVLAFVGVAWTTLPMLLLPVCRCG